MESLFTTREQIVEVANKLFVYTDSQQWAKLQEDVFAGTVLFDMSSLGAGEPKKLAAADICSMWEAGFRELDAVHHQAGNYIVNLHGDTADMVAYAIALHFKNSATDGKTREFVGSYDLHFVKTEFGWRIDGFRYNVKFISGNVDLK